MTDEIKKDTVDYNDQTPFDGSKLQPISEISKAIRHKTYGVDTREAIAQQGEALVKLMQETGGNQSAEVIAARGNHELLQMREDAQDNAITKAQATADDKFSKADGDVYLKSITAIPETFANLAAIKAKYPIGKNGLMIAADNGHKYIWENNVWTDAGVYQSVGIADRSITIDKLAFIPELIDGKPTPNNGNSVISTVKYLGQEWTEITSTTNGLYRGIQSLIDNPDKISAMTTYPVKINFNIRSSIDQTLILDVNFYDSNGTALNTHINIDSISLKASEILNYQKELSLYPDNIIGATKVSLNLYVEGTNDMGTVLINNYSAVLEYKQSGANASDNFEGYYNLPIVKINGDLRGMTKDNAKKVTYEYHNGNTVLTGSTEIKWQGNSSIHLNKKGYRLKLFTDNTFTEKEKVQFIPSWSPTSKINLKAYYTDGILSRDVVNANIGADIASTNFSLPNDLKQEDNFGFIDGFPIALIFNNKFEGIYSFNTARSDFSYTKYAIMGSGYTDVTHFTSTNKGDVKLDGSDFESLNPEDEATDDEKSAVGDLVTWVATSSDENFKADFEKHLDLKTTIDYFILTNLLASTDSFVKNQIFLSWDGVKWFMQAYDLDSTLGIEWNGKERDLPTGLIGTDNYLFNRLSKLFASEISARYAELRTWLTPAYVLDKYKKRINEIGVGNYQREFAKWNNPSKDISTYKQLKNAVLHQFSLLDQIWLNK